MTSIHPASLPPDKLLAQCEVTRGRASGPGGQHRNKVETAVRLTHRPSGLSAAATERRSQAQNLRVAVFRLRLKLAVEMRHPVDRGARPSELWHTRCRRGRVTVNPGHNDYPAMLAEALDVLEAHGYEPALAAMSLDCSTTQLVKLIKAEPAAMRAMNEHRDRRGLHALK